MSKKPSIALTHIVSPKINDCELTFFNRQEINYALAIKQHADYCLTLQKCGLDVRIHYENADNPDCCFVEDPAVVLDEIAVITRFGAISRRPETDLFRSELSKYRTIKEITAPGILEGGDVLFNQKKVFVGMTKRSNKSGLEQFRSFLTPFGYQVTGVNVSGCLHLKSGCCFIDENTLLANPAYLDLTPFQEAGYRILPLPDTEPGGADLLRIGDYLVYPTAYPKTASLLQKYSGHLMLVDLSELIKAEAGVTCLSLIFKSG